MDFYSIIEAKSKHMRECHEFSLEVEALIERTEKDILNKKFMKVDYYFITVNPKPDIKLDVFLKHINNFIKRKPVINYYYTIEQRGESEAECGKGFHSHILVYWDQKMSKKVRQYAGESFKRVIGANNNHIININKIPKEYLQDKLDYMNGLKWDPEKDLKLKIDILFREKNNLLLLYKKDGSIPETCKEDCLPQTHSDQS